MNALVVVKPNELVDERTCLRKRGKLVAVDTFWLENGKEILSHGIVPKGAGSRSSCPGLTWGNHAVFFSQAEICKRGVLKALAAVELQLPSGLLFSQCIADGSTKPTD
ncbi:MAG: hypothetical protein UGF45_07610 [Massilioclostridium sp.]|nr:hypothetical protein [Massilioclostridium sp.]